MRIELQKILRSRRRGVSSIIAMLYLVLFSTLALGAYTATTTSVQVSYNDRDVNGSRAAAETGMEFARFQLAQINISHGSTTQPSVVWDAIYTQLSTQLNNTSNLGSDVVARNNGVITIPGNTANWIGADGTGSKFQLSIWQDPANNQRLIVKSTGQGRSGTALRAVQMKYAIAQRASSIFNYGVASKGAITTSGNTQIVGATDPAKGSVLSATMSTNTPVSLGGSSSVSGDVSIVNAAGQVANGGSATVAGYASSSSNYAQHIHIGVPAPDFPTVDVAAFTPYPTNVYVPGNKNLVNVYIPPNTNPTFNGNTTIQGVLLIDTPNNVKFNGNLTIQGVIVTQNNPTGTPGTNVINFAGNVSATSISTLPSGSTFPDTERALTNVFLLAPDFTVNFSGNFGTVGGSIIASNINFSGNAGGTVVGSVIGTDDIPMTVTGSSDIIISSTGTTAYPPGVFFGSDYVPLSDTWQEVHP
jgi:Tfp pilus assembly protein PilX